MTREQIVEAARSYLKVPFKRGGRDRKGVDCVGLLVCIATDLGVHVDDTTDYGFHPEPQKFNDVIYSQTTRRPLTPIMSGSIAILRQSIFPMHTGIVVNNSGRITIINANLTLRRVVEEEFDVWRHLVIEFRDYKGIQ